MTRIFNIKFTFLAGLCLALCGAILDRAIPGLWQYAPSISVQLSSASIPDISATLLAIAFFIAVLVALKGMTVPKKKD